MFYSLQSLYLFQFLHFSSGVLSQSTNAPLVSRQTLAEYEYIVVGSGAGGGPLAARLALNGRKVLLIEAGDDSTGESLNQTVPVFHPYATEDPDMSWDFFVKHYADEGRAKTDSKMVWNTPSGGRFIGTNPPAGSKQKGILYPRSATLGGCTAHNAMVNVYPHASDWINIANITGDTTWNPDNMRKLYQRMEKVDYVPNGTAGHGFDGWLGTSKPPVTLAGIDNTLITIGTESGKQISKNAEEEGMNIQRVVEGDMNEWTPKRDQTEGSWLIPLAINSGVPGKRAGSRDFILSVSNAKTETGAKKYPLDIVMNTLVTKVIFDSKVTKGKPRATGVEFLKGKAIYKADPRWQKNEKEQGTEGQVFASKEVILSGGAYNTPQLLKLSGIGPRDELERFKIPVKVDLPGVGTNLQDHNEIAVTHEAIEPFQVVEGCTYGEAGDPCLDRWRKGEGVYGASNGFIYGIIKKSTVAHLDTVYGNDPDIFLFGGIAAFRGYYPRYSREVYGHKSWTWVILRAHTSNTAGTVKLTSASPLDTPEIIFNYFDTGSAGAGARDLTAMSEAIDLARKISVNVETDPKQGPILTKETNPGTNILSNSTAMMDYIKAESWGHHASCTCAIGSDKDPNAVLDSKFRVRGVDGLRVVDASVFPRIPGFFIAAPTYMIAEKAADSILTGN